MFDKSKTMRFISFLTSLCDLGLILGFIILLTSRWLVLVRCHHCSYWLSFHRKCKIYSLLRWSKLQTWKATLCWGQELAILSFRCWRDSDRWKFLFSCFFRFLQNRFFLHRHICKLVKWIEHKLNVSEKELLSLKFPQLSDLLILEL